MPKIKIDRDFTKNRSDKYQHLIVESSCSPDILTEYSDSRGITGVIDILEDKEEFMELKLKLKEAFWRIIDTCLTDRQKQVIHLCAEGRTQIEIASLLGVNQSSITKSIHGNCDYRNGKKIYGGAKKKLIRIADADAEIQSLLHAIYELQGDVERT